MLTAAAAAMPLSDPLDARDAASAQITYYGICTKANNECKYKNQNGKDTFVKCPRFANKKCSRDYNECSYDSVSRAVLCR